MAEPICHPHRCRMCSLVCLEGLKFVCRCLESGNQCICIVYIWVYIYTIYETFQKRVRVLMFHVCHYVTVLFSPKCEIILELYHKSITHQNGKISSPGASFWKPGVEPRRKKSLRGFTVLLPQTLSVRCRHATRPMRRMMCLGCFFWGFLEKKCFKWWKFWGCEPVTKNCWKMVWLVLRYFSAKTTMTIEKRKWWFWKKTFLLRWHLMKVLFFHLFLIIIPYLSQTYWFHYCHSWPYLYLQNKVKTFAGPLQVSTSDILVYVYIAIYIHTHNHICIQ